MSEIHKPQGNDPVNAIKLSQILSQNQFFSGIPEPQIVSAINSCADTITKKNADIICEQGEGNHDLFILLEGKCDVIFNKNKVAEIEAVDTIGEMGFILENERSATVIAVNLCNIMSFNADKFNEFLKKNRAISETIHKNVIQILANRIKKSNEEIGWLVWT